MFTSQYYQLVRLFLPVIITRCLTRAFTLLVIWTYIHQGSFNRRMWRGVTLKRLLTCALVLFLLLYSVDFSFLGGPNEKNHQNCKTSSAACQDQQYFYFSLFPSSLCASARIFQVKELLVGCLSSGLSVLCGHSFCELSWIFINMLKVKARCTW